MSTYTSLLLSSLLTVVACDGATAETPASGYPAGVTCALFSESDIDVDNRDVLGFSGEDAARQASHSGQLVWHDGAETTITVTAVPLEGAPVSVRDAPPFNGYCRPTMSIPVSLSIVTSDGRLDETMETELLASSDDERQELLSVSGGSAQTEVLDLGGVFVVPEDFVKAGHGPGKLGYDFWWSTSPTHSHYCRGTETPSDDPSDRCTRYNVLRFGSTTAEFVHHHETSPDDIFSAAAGWWVRNTQ